MYVRQSPWSGIFSLLGSWYSNTFIRRSPTLWRLVRIPVRISNIDQGIPIAIGMNDDRRACSSITFPKVLNFRKAVKNATACKCSGCAGFSTCKELGERAARDRSGKPEARRHVRWPDLERIARWCASHQAAKMMLCIFPKVLNFSGSR